MDTCRTLERLKKRNKKQNEHIKSNYKRVSVVIRNDVYQRIINIYGEDISMNGFINELILSNIEEYEESVRVEEDEEQKTAEVMPEFMRD